MVITVLIMMKFLRPYNENILLQATDEGLGAVWLGFYPIEDRTLKLKEYLNIPDYCIPFSVICVGYPQNKTSVKLRFDESKIHYEPGAWAAV